MTLSANRVRLRLLQSGMRFFLAWWTLVLVPALPCGAGPGQTFTSWLDRPLENWNAAARSLPAAPTGGEGRDQLVARCKVEAHRQTPAEQALAAAGWIPLPHAGRPLVRDDIEILDGVAAMDRSCDPTEFNAFVFVGGRFAGTVSPVSMGVKRDGLAGPIRLVAADAITVDFARYRKTDPECCPSAHVSVRFRIDRGGPSPLVLPVSLQQTRG